MVRKSELKSRSILFCSFYVRSYFIYTDLISSLLDPSLIDPGLTFDSRWCIRSYVSTLYLQILSCKRSNDDPVR